MPIVDQSPEVEARRAKQIAALTAAIDLRGLDLPDASLDAWTDGTLGIRITRTDGSVDQATADLLAWLTALGISKYTATDGAGPTIMTAHGDLGDVPIKVDVHVYGTRASRTTVRTVAS